EAAARAAVVTVAWARKSRRFREGVMVFVLRDGPGIRAGSGTAPILPPPGPCYHSGGRDHAPPLGPRRRRGASRYDDHCGSDRDPASRHDAVGDRARRPALSPDRRTILPDDRGGGLRRRRPGGTLGGATRRE